jgi:SAM-dependent methyltransferase
MKDRYEFILNHVSESEPGARILEVGAEPYQLPVAYQQLGYEVVGLDLDPDRGSSVIENNNLDIRQADINHDRFPLEDDSFDIVVFSEVFEHLFRPVHALNEIHRVLRPEGELLLTTPNLYRLGNIVRFLSGDGFDDAFGQWEKLERIGHMGHVRQYSRPQVVEFLEKTGFTVQDSECVSFSGSSHLLAPAINMVYKTIPFTRPFQYALASPQIAE